MTIRTTRERGRARRPAAGAAALAMLAGAGRAAPLRGQTAASSLVEDVADGIRTRLEAAAVPGALTAEGDPLFAALSLGRGKYRRASTHGPLIHVDTRLYRARW